MFVLIIDDVIKEGGGVQKGSKVDDVIYEWPEIKGQIRCNIFQRWTKWAKWLIITI